MVQESTRYKKLALVALVTLTQYNFIIIFFTKAVGIIHLGTLQYEAQLIMRPACICASVLESFKAISEYSCIPSAACYWHCFLMAFTSTGGPI